MIDRDERRGVRGVVIDAATGAPLPAVVRLIRSRPGAEPVDLAELQTLADGRFVFPPGGVAPTEVAARSAGHAIATQRIQGDAEIVVALDRAATVVGFVRNEAGTGIVGAEVWAMATNGPLDDKPVSESAYSVDGGAYEIPDVPLGAIYLGASARGYAGYDSPSAVAEAVSGAVVHADITLRQGAVLHGVVTADGHPVGRALIDAVTDRKQFGVGAHTETASDGSWLLPGVPAGDVLVVATHPAVGLASAEITVAVGEEQEVTLDLAAIATVEGRVVDALGTPVSGALVTTVFAGDDVASDDAAEHARYDSFIETDANGSFRLASLPQGMIRIRAQLRGRGWGAATVKPPAHDVLIRFQDVHVISGRVIDAEGNPVHEGKIEVTGNYVREDPVGADGRFTIGLSEEWPRSVGVRYRGGAGSMRSQEIAVGTRDVVFRLQSAPKAKGRIVNSNGSPLAGAWIGTGRWQSFDGTLAMRPDSASRSGLDGSFTIPLEIGQNDIVAWTAGFRGTAIRNVEVQTGEVHELGDVVLLRGPGSSAPTPRCGVGLAVSDATPAGIRVESVAPGSAADEQRVQSGDEIVAVSDAPVDELTADEVERLLLGTRGTTVSVGVRGSGGTVRELLLDRR